MSDPVTRQENLNRLYAQILKIDEDGKDFLTNIVTQAVANRGFPGMVVPIGGLVDKKGTKAGIEP
jgi:hypothetical protein